MKKVVFILIVLIALPFFALATSHPGGGLGELSPGDPIGRTGGIDSTSLSSVFINLVNWFAWFVALAAVVMGLYSGFLFITARDEEAQLKKAKSVFVYTIVGIIVAVLAFSIVLIARSFAGL